MDPDWALFVLILEKPGLARSLSRTLSYDHDLAPFVQLAFPEPLTEHSALTRPSVNSSARSWREQPPIGAVSPVPSEPRQRLNQLRLAVSRADLSATEVISAK